MARIHRQTGSLHDLLHEIGDSRINSLDDINAFKQNYPTAPSEIKERAKLAISQGIEKLRTKVGQLSGELDSKLKENKDRLESEKADIDRRISLLADEQGNFFVSLMRRIKRRPLLKRKAYLDAHFDEEARKPLKTLQAEILAQVDTLKNNEANTGLLVEREAWPQMNRLSMIKSVLEHDNDLYLGAIGEENVLTELEKLPNSFFVINDFRKTFYPPIYNRRTDDRINSIQVDHLVCGPTGLFIIETKNWSEHSFQNIDFFSPVKQVQRFNFALFVILNQAVESGYLHSFVSHLGSQKISPINIVATLQPPPSQEFQYVKMMSCYSLRSHIENSKRVFSEENVNDLEQFLLGECS